MSKQILVHKLHSSTISNQQRMEMTQAAPQLLTDNCTWGIPAVEYYAATKRNGVPGQRRNLENRMPSGRSQAQRGTHCGLLVCKMSGGEKSRETGSWVAVARVLGEANARGSCSGGLGRHLGRGKRFGARCRQWLQHVLKRTKGH